MIILFILALVMALAAHLGFDRHREIVHHPIVHWQSAGLVIAVSVIMGFLTQWVIDWKYGSLVPIGFYRWYHFAFLSLCLHFSVFDPIWNALHGYAWNYHGTPSNPNRSWFDRAWEKSPALFEIFLRAVWVPMVGYGVYFNWGQIVGN